MLSESFSLAIRFISRSSRHCFSAVKAIAILLIIILSLSALLNGAGAQLLNIVLAVGDSEYLYIIEENSISIEESFIDTQILETLEYFYEANIEGYLPQTYNTLPIQDQNQSFLAEIWGINVTTLREFRSEIKIDQGSGPNFIGTRLLNSLNTSLPYTLQIPTGSEENTPLNLTGELSGSLRFDESIILPIQTTYTLFPHLEN
ncbi:MAG: hypothetical protein ACFFBD_25285, partial [Candidatus Hodarchaeota archaeon]